MALSTPTPTTSSFFTSSPAAAAPIAGFTTPFPQPASCSLSSFQTTVVSTYTSGSTTEFRTTLLPDQSDARYKSCVDPAGRGIELTFSPAVCPQGWPAMWLGKTTTTGSLVSTAYCCAPGYSLRYTVSYGETAPSCSQTFFRTSSTSGVVSTLSVAYAPAWMIEWQTTDLPTLNPRPPAIEGETITQWIPGSDPQRLKSDHWGGGISWSLFLFLAAGIPTIVVVLIGACVWRCVVRFRKRRRLGLGTGRTKSRGKHKRQPQQSEQTNQSNHQLGGTGRTKSRQTASTTSTTSTAARASNQSNRQLGSGQEPMK